jgi:hypothetical protein
MYLSTLQFKAVLAPKVQKIQDGDCFSRKKKSELACEESYMSN